MTTGDYRSTFHRFETLVRGRPRDRTMAALIVDSPWLPGYAGASTLDFYFDRPTWLAVYEKVHRELPDAALLPGAWVEFGMAAEPSGWGAAVQWSPESPPSVRGFPGDLAALARADVPDPEKDGLMPIVLRQYEHTGEELRRRGTAPRMAAARGPLAVAAHLVGVTELLMATQLEPENTHKVLDKTTDLCIAWLRAQLRRMEDPIGVLVLDDLVGMLGPADLVDFALGRLRRIFDAFPDLLHFFHNDTPNEKVFEGLATVGIDVFNFSHEIPVERARELLGPDMVLMGNIPPLDVLVRGTPGQVRKATEELLGKVESAGPMLISPGGGVSPGTPIENLKAMVETVETAQPRMMQ